MKSNYFLVGACALGLLAMPNALKGQDEVGQFLAGGAADANYLMNGYMAPLGNAFGAGLNNGWYNTARPKKLLRFDITGGASLVFAPSDAKVFNIVGSELNNIQPVGASSVEAPTIFGSAEPGPELAVMQEDPFGNMQEVARFNAPQGLGVAMMPVPYGQIGIGLIKKTELTLRYFPTISVPAGDAKFNVGMFGLGIKHDILQWIPGGDKMPFDLSGFFGYTSFKSDYGISLDPDYAPGTAQNPNGGPYSDQKLEFNSTAWTARVLISKKLAMFTFYGGLGYNNANTEINVVGNYPVTVYETDPNSPLFGQEVVRDISNPVSINATDASGFILNAGFRMKILWILALHADYTLGKYSAATVGFGINVDF